MFSTIAASALALTLLQPVQSIPPALGVSARSAASARPKILTSLYVSYGSLQVLDVHSTSRALASGSGREANPALRGIAGNPAALIAVKAATAGATIWATEKLRKKHRAAAIGFMAALNSFMAVVVAHNYSIQ